jgi:cyclopropane fatty-acyl-phospholipid synthase-like methyltransferase
MGDDWFGIANLDHFWIQRRFEVLRKLAGRLIQQSTCIAEVGCGHGLLQRQIEDHYHREVTGFDLNEGALQQTASRVSPVCCYDVFQKSREYQSHFDLLLLFDVLEHLRDEDSFLDAIKFHVAPQGSILINVPALQSLYSVYDSEVGHFRRYNIASLTRVVQRSGLIVKAWTYWGLPLLPLLMIRKLWLMTQPRERIISSGMDSRGSVMNHLLLWTSRFEPVPQRLVGTSLMAVVERQAR